ncbi:dCTP deaminase domain-containing protein [Martelella lutilitoris]|nr:hypothetical protein [Martelella lutilitoris]
MTIVSLQNRITTDLSEFEALKSSDSSKIYCQAEKIEQFNIILTLGDQWASNVSRSDPAMFMIESGEISIQPQTSVVVEVQEKIHVPYNVVGIISQKGSAFLEDGLIVAAGKVDPSFSGHLQLLIFNSTRLTKKIKQGEELANLMFIRTDSTIKASLFQHQQSAKFKERGRFSRIIRFFSRDPKYTLNLIITILTSGVVAVATIYFANRTPILNDRVDIKTEIDAEGSSK